MSERIPLRSEDAGIPIELHRPFGDSAAERPAVLLLHGASANHGTFTVNAGGLAKWLAEKGYDPWLLDWRGSSLVVDDVAKNSADLLNHDGLFTFNAAAAFDVRAALEAMRARNVRFPIAMIGHCMGGAVLAEAVALGHVTPDDVDRLVILTLGLFYRVPRESQLKANEKMLERLCRTTFENRPYVAIDPRPDRTKGEVLWPPDLREMYDRASGGEFHRRVQEEDNEKERDGLERALALDMCNHLCFMYGMVYHHRNLVKEIHDTDAPVLRDQFGAIPIQMFLHASRNVLRTNATSYLGTLSDAGFVSDRARRRFEALSRITLITGVHNLLWSRGSIDLMYEWLRCGSSRGRGWAVKHVIPGYGHQDLLWGRRAADDVFPHIERGVQSPQACTGTSPGVAQIV